MPLAGRLAIRLVRLSAAAAAESSRVAGARRASRRASRSSRSFLCGRKRGSTATTARFPSRRQLLTDNRPHWIRDNARRSDTSPKSPPSGAGCRGGVFTAPSLTLISLLLKVGKISGIYPKAHACSKESGTCLEASACRVVSHALRATVFTLSHCPGRADADAARGISLR